MRPFQFLDYDKLSDEVLYLGSKLYLRMNVSLSQKQDPDIRYHYHKEYSFESAYSDGRLISIKRSYDYYLSFDKTDQRAFVIIRPQDMIILQRSLSKVVQWFEDKEHNAFYIRHKNLIVKKQQPIIINGLSLNSYLKFEPIVILAENDNKQTPGVRITLGNEAVYADVTIDKLYGLVYTIQNFNMYGAAQNLLNYLGRPDFGTNLIEITNDIHDSDDGEAVTGGFKNDGKIVIKNKGTFFDKINKERENNNEPH